MALASQDAQESVGFLSSVPANKASEVDAPIAWGQNEGWSKRYGFVWFDPSRAPEGAPWDGPGLWSVAGEPAVDFDHWRQLPSGVSWWCSLPDTDARVLSRWVDAHGQGVLGIPWQLIIESWGQERDDPSDVTRRCAELWTRLVCRLHDTEARRLPEQPWRWVRGHLPEMLASRLHEGSRSRPLETNDVGGSVGANNGLSSGLSSGLSDEHQSAALTPIIAQACFDWLPAEVSPGWWLGRRRIVLSPPLYTLYQALWHTPYPDDSEGWQELDEGLWPARMSDRRAWVIQTSQPLLLRVDDWIWSSDARAQSLGQLWLGQRGRRFPGAARDPLWLTGEEVRQWSQWATLQIGAGYRASGWRQAPPPPDWVFPQDEPLAPFSMSAGLLTHAAFRSVGPGRDPSTRIARPATAQALWWYAAERARLFEHARILHESGWPVSGYGRSGVELRLDPAADATHLAAAGLAAGLALPPALALALSRTGPTPPENAFDDPVWVALLLRQGGDPELIADFDRLIFPWPGSTDQIKAMMSIAGSRVMTWTKTLPASWQDLWRGRLRSQAQRSARQLRKDAATAAGSR